MLINIPIANLYSKPAAGELEDQTLYGEEADVLEKSGGFARIRTEYGYEGWIEEGRLAVWRYDGAVTRVETPFCTVLDIPGYRGRTMATLPRGARVEMTGEDTSFAEVRLIGGERGFIRRSHIAALPGKLKEAELRRAVAETAKAYLGVPYLWGGRSPGGMDCSGLCHTAYWLNGVAIYRNSRMAEGFPVKEIDPEKMDLGDLIYFTGHMAMYLGGGKYIHATGRDGDDRVVINSLLSEDAGYREDLAKGVVAVGSVFCDGKRRRYAVK